MAKIKIKYRLEELFGIIDRIDVPDTIKKVDLQHVGRYLEFLRNAENKRLVIDDFQLLEPWAILLLASLGIKGSNNQIFIENNRSSNPAKFATALGLDCLIKGEKIIGELQEKRTVRICRITDYKEIEPVAEKIARLIIAEYAKEKPDKFFEEDEVRKTIRYVLIELLRNVIQHSMDFNGALVVAQRMDKDHTESENSFIQIAVLDRGIGIMQSLRTTRTQINDPIMALERSLWPAYSGKFSEFQTGTAQNAGMGLFFVSEMAKLTAGKFLISSRGASLFIEGDPGGSGNNKIEKINEEVDGTLVVFEMPKRGVVDYESLVRTIMERAAERKERRENRQWIRFDIPKVETLEFVINVASENTVKAEEFSKQELLPRIKNRQILTLNFVNINVCTQSFMHSLIYEAVKLAYALKVPLFARNATHAIADQIRMVEMYGL